MMTELSMSTLRERQEGFEANLLQTKPEEGSLLALRFYGPTEALTSWKWKLNGVVKLK
jgi:hypothetical protein